MRSNSKFIPGLCELAGLNSFPKPFVFILPTGGSKAAILTRTWEPLMPEPDAFVVVPDELTCHNSSVA